MEKVEYPSITHQVNTGCGKLYITMLFDPQDTNQIAKILLELGKNGTCAKAHLASYSQLLTAMVNDMPVNKTILALNNACGNICHAGHDSCIEVVNRHFIDYLIRRRDGS